MLITDFAMTEQGMSHHLPQLLGALVMPILLFRFIVRRLADVYCYVFIPSYFFLILISLLVFKETRANSNSG